MKSPWLMLLYFTEQCWLQITKMGSNVDEYEVRVPYGTFQQELDRILEKFGLHIYSRMIRFRIWVPIFDILNFRVSKASRVNTVLEYRYVLRYYGSI